MKFKIGRIIFPWEHWEFNYLGTPKLTSESDEREHEDNESDESENDDHDDDERAHDENYDG